MIIKNRFRKVFNSFHRITASHQLLAIALISLGLNACYNEPTFFGGDLIPDGDKTSVQVTDTFQVAAYTIRTDTIITSTYRLADGTYYYGSPHAILGFYNDKKMFGGTKSEYFTRIYPSNVKDSLLIIGQPRPTIDSVILKLKLIKTWGELNKQINVRVYQLKDSIKTKKLYNGLDPSELNYYATQVNEPLVYRGEEYLKIRFTDAFRDSLNADSSTLASRAKFLEHMKGLYFTVDNTDPKGALYSISLSGFINMYYEKPNITGKKTRSFPFTIGSYGFNHFVHDSTIADPALKIHSRSLSSINDNTPQDTVFGVEGMGGVRGLIKLKGVKQWKKLMPIVIHRAELRFDIQEQNELPSDSISKKLFFYNFRGYTLENNSIKEFPLADAINTSSYNKAKKYYSIDVTFHLQSLLRNKISRDYIIVENDNCQYSFMQGLYRTGNNSKPIKLIITYSKL